VYCYYYIIDGHLSRIFRTASTIKKYYDCVYTAGKTPVVQYVLERVHNNNNNNIKHSDANRLPGISTSFTLMDILNTESVRHRLLERVTDTDRNDIILYVKNKGTTHKNDKAETKIIVKTCSTYDTNNCEIVN